MREVQLLVQVKFVLQITQLTVSLVVVLACEPSDQVTKRLLNELFLAIGLLEMLDLLGCAQLEFFHGLPEEWVIVGGLERFLGFLAEGLAHRELLFFEGLRHIMLNLAVVLPDRLKTKDGLLPLVHL